MIIKKPRKIVTLERKRNAILKKHRNYCAKRDYFIKELLALKPITPEEFAEMERLDVEIKRHYIEMHPRN